MDRLTTVRSHSTEMVVAIKYRIPNLRADWFA
jgi:hypothetical protein